MHKIKNRRAADRKAAETLEKKKKKKWRLSGGFNVSSGAPTVSKMEEVIGSVG